MADHDRASNEAKSFSRRVISKQTACHVDLLRQIDRHLAVPFQKPIADHSRAAFNKMCAIRNAAPQAAIVFDSGCGTGDSARQLALAFPTHLVFGIDKSAYRLSRAREATPPNCHLIRGDLIDIVRLAARASWALDLHYILYPNPWPKPQHLGRRWHGSPIWPDLLKLGGRLELRTNWAIYAEEFAAALRHAGVKTEAVEFIPTAPAISPFEAKYHASGHPLFRVCVDLPMGLPSGSKAR